MKFTRDTLRTVLALILIVIIVVATFAYGNAQRNKQKTENDVKVAQTEQKNSSSKSSNGTASNNSGLANTGGAQNTQTVAPTVPDTGGTAQPQPTTMPETGAETGYTIPLSIIALVGYLYLRSRQRLAFAQSR